MVHICIEIKNKSLYYMKKFFIILLLIIFYIASGCKSKQNTITGNIDIIEIVDNSISVNDTIEKKSDNRNTNKSSTLIRESNGVDEIIMYVDSCDGVHVYEEMDHRSKYIKTLLSYEKLSILEKHLSNNPDWAHLDYDIYWYRVDTGSEIGWVMDGGLVEVKPSLAEDQFMIDAYQPTAIDYDNILDGDLSAFAGIYRRDGADHQMILKSNGVIIFSSNDPFIEGDEYTESNNIYKEIPSGFRKHDDGYYFWDIIPSRNGIYIDGGYRIYLFPAGIEVWSYGHIPTDTKRIRLCSGQDGPNSRIYNLIQRE